MEGLLGAISDVLVKKRGPLVGCELRYLRKFSDFASKDFAKLLGVTPEHLSRLENGAKPLAPTLDKLSRALVAASRNKGVNEVLLRAPQKGASARWFPRLTWKKDHWESAA
jgi:transcriptional regulator with XRE-family HTH domain